MFSKLYAVAVLIGGAWAKFEFVGMNEAGPEFGEKNIPGIKDKDYTWFNLSSIDYFTSRGMNTFRLNIMMERIIPKRLNGSFEPVYLADLQKAVDYITKKGAYAMINPHNYGRYYGDIITDVKGFEQFWNTLATPFKSNEKVIFDTNNEFHDMDQSLVVRLNQAAINGIRAAGATSQIINVEGNSWTGAWTWVSRSQNGATMGSLTDPSNKIQYQMHQYLDSDGSGSHEECVSRTIGEERLREATKWLKDNKKVGILGEFAGADNPVCKDAIKGMLEYMRKNEDVWKGWLWWSAGPWWGSYMFSMEPNGGKALQPYIDLLVKYL